jgi:type I restriction enzyme S subunit
MLPAHSICVSCIATVGLVAITSKPSHTNQQINSVVPHKDFSPYYCYFALRNLGDEIIAHGSGGSVYLNLSKSRFSALSVLIPPVALMNRYQQTVEPVFESMLMREKESQTLAELRDTLLPKLISGQLRVPDAQKLIGKAL